MNFLLAADKESRWGFGFDNPNPPFQDKKTNLHHLQNQRETDLNGLAYSKSAIVVFSKV